MLLWLDDNRAPPPGWTWAKTANEAAYVLAVHPVTYASLDHDLGIHQPTGYDLVRWMIRTSNWPQYRPGVHSANPQGSLNMIEAIIEHGPYI